MEKLLQSLSQLVKEACKYPPGSKERQKKLTQIIRLVNNRLWQENTAYYQDALQETWIYFCRNICEGKSGKVYEPERSSVVTWLNNYLRWRLKDYYIKTEKHNRQTVSVQVDRNEEVIDLLDNLPAIADPPPLLQEIENWALTDPQNKLRRIYLDSHPQVTAQALIIKRLPPETTWEKLAEEYGVQAGTLSSFYQRKCKPLLREFSQDRGYI